MHTQQYSLVRWLGCLALLLGLCVGSQATAHAGHRKAPRPLDFTPYTLDPKEVRVGLQSVEMGLWGHPLLEQIDVGVSPLTYLSFAAGIKGVSAHGKYEMYRDETLSLAFAGGMHWLDFEGADVPAKFIVIPLSLYAGVRFNDRWFATGGVAHTSVRVKAEGEVGPIDVLGGAVGTESLQIRSALRYRWSDRTLLSLDARVAGFQRQFLEGNIDPDADDGDNDGVYARVEGDVIGADLGLSVGTSVHWQWDSFNLELGVEYGAYSIPLVQFIVPKAIVAPRLDFYWRF